MFSMNHRYLVTLFLLAAFSLSAIIAFAVSAWRRPHRLLFVLAAFGIGAHAQNWSTFIDPSRAINWSSAGFSIPSYTVACPTQPSLATGSGAASANATAIQNALASCTATQNVVNLPSGTYYVAGFQYGSQGKQVLRGAGANSTFLISTSENGCGGINHGICMIDGSPGYNGSSRNLPGGTTACSWTAGYSQGTTTITLSSCGGPPPLNQTIILDQANDTSDTGGVYICDTNIAGCGYEGSSGGNDDGRFISGVTYSQQQVVYVTAVSGSGSGPYTVTISPGVYFTNVRSSQTPGAWWPGFVQNDGLENLSVDASADPDGTIMFFDCYECWVKGVRVINSGRNSVMPYQSANDVVRDSYFYGAQGSGSQSYSVEIEESSGILVENNIFQQVTNPLMFGQSSGSVVDYNYSIFSFYNGDYVQQSYESHNAGNEMNLFEGNDFLGIQSDDAWGSSAQDTFFRNMLYGYQNGKSQNTIPIVLRSWNRGYNIVGNILGQPGYTTAYQTYATSSTALTGPSEANSAYSLGLSSQDSCTTTAVICDTRTVSSLMRWGNYDVVNAAVRWNSTEAAPASGTYFNANFSTSYFTSLAQTLPTSLYYNSQPSWWTSGKNWPPTGPDVSTGNVGYCTSGTYIGAQATSASQCVSGGLTTAWASHVTSLPAMDCYLNAMGGLPDGSGSALSFNASQCYSSSGTTGGKGPGVPTGLQGSAVVP
jgi:hypothetical protein